MAVAATIAPSTLNRLTRALEKEKPSYLVVSSLERDAQTLLGTEDAPWGTLSWVCLLQWKTESRILINTLIKLLHQTVWLWVIFFV